MDRRTFLVTAGGAGLAAALPFRAQGQELSPPRARDATSFYVDTQGSPFDGFEEVEGRLVPTERLIGALRDRRIDLIAATVGPVGNGDNRYRDTVDQIAFWDRTIAASPAAVNTSANRSRYISFTAE